MAWRAWSGSALPVKVWPTPLAPGPAALHVEATGQRVEHGNAVERHEDRLLGAEIHVRQQVQKLAAAQRHHVLARHDAAAVPDQEPEQVEFLLGQMNPLAADAGS